MKIETHRVNGVVIAEVVSEDVLIATADDALNLLGDVYYQGFDRLILQQSQLTEDFFDLKNGMAGEMLQKFSNYRVGLAIVGDFTKYTSQSIRDFIFESNKTRHINFVGTVAEAIDRLGR